MELAIPIFRALIASDADGVYHRNHGELGFALKDKRDPEWQEALGELTIAIDMRGTPASDKGWAAYEAVRALCRINLDSGYNSGQPTETDASKEIVADLKVAEQDPFAKTLLGKPDIKRWLVINRGVPGVDPAWEQIPPIP